MSRSQLFRKLKALTGQSTTHFIRSIRLAKGKELLETTTMTISEVVYAVGFSWLDYVSSMFKEELNETDMAFLRNAMSAQQAFTGKFAYPHFFFLNLLLMLRTKHIQISKSDSA